MAEDLAQMTNVC